jgi:hypothetical protein
MIRTTIKLLGGQGTNVVVPAIKENGEVESYDGEADHARSTLKKFGCLVGESGGLILVFCVWSRWNVSYVSVLLLCFCAPTWSLSIHSESGWVPKVCVQGVECNKLELETLCCRF